MGQQTAEKLGEPVIAGTIIQTAGTGKAAMRSGVTGAATGPMRFSAAAPTDPVLGGPTGRARCCWNIYQ